MIFNDMIFSKGNKLNSIIPILCPQCHKGKFLEKQPYNFSEFTKVRTHCTNCGLKYSLEPSFYFGSMFVSYALGVALMIGIIAVSYWTTKTFSFQKTFIAICIILILLGPYINALSKIIWANIFFSYKEDSIKDS